MKSILRSVTMASVLALGVVGAHAADLAYEPVPVAAPEVFNWTGFYVGVHGGIGGGNIDTQSRSPLYEGEGGLYQEGSDWSDNAFGAFGGVQAGYNYQFATNWVAGVEADFAGSGIKAEHNEQDVYIEDGITYNESFYNVEAKIDWFGTIRGRLGYAWDNFLVYGTGGAAYGKVKLEGSAGYNGETYNSFSGSETNWGWTAGAGFEYGLTKNITLKTEYLYVDLGSVTASIGDGEGGIGTGSADIAFHTLKAGLNYKF
jgi:outer membrane immunogenic protein